MYADGEYEHSDTLPVPMSWSWDGAKMTTGILTYDPQLTARECCVSSYDPWPVARDGVETDYEMMFPKSQV